jgi:enoyl-CoA hydratase/carnithine racemase
MGLADEGYEALELTQDGQVLTVTLNRPDRMNAFNPTMVEELARVWTAVRTDDTVNAVVLTGAGEKAFCTGIDREGVPGEEGEYDFDPFVWEDPGKGVSPKSQGLWKPVIAAVNGMACGGAFYMLGEVEFIIAAEHATFFDPHLTYGAAAVLEPTLMANRMPFGEIMRISLMGNNERVSARRAYEIGLVSEVVSAADLISHAQQVAAEIAEAPTVPTQATVRNLWLSREPARTNALEVGNYLLNAGNSAEAMAEGQQRFLSRGRRGYRTR